MTKRNKVSLLFIYMILSLIVINPGNAFSQVELRDSIINWQHHSFELNDDYSMKTYSTDDNDIQQIQFNAKVIENELIRLVVIPEYGARVISFVYKPTNHEYLYQSECGSPYGIGEGNFYYDWLMVYGGIFPTFPESEHGKTWLKPWKYDIVKNTNDTVIIGMEYTDTTLFANAPGNFNNGITNITCRIEVGVFMGSSLWDFDVSLKNNKEETVPYEYWTCTSLTPGSDQGNTGSPLNSEMIVPIKQYEAAWSPGSWIGNWGSLYNFETIDHLSKWNDMGIAYADNLSDNYWGVINHENEEGIFRISENVETSGMKFWTWGKNNVNNNLFDFSNGGKDNYLELWAGNSLAFFEDATLSPLEEISWKESYNPTVAMTSIANINRDIAVNVGWNQDAKELYYELFAFSPNQEYQISLYLNGEEYHAVIDKTIYANALGNNEGFILDDIAEGVYNANFEIYDINDNHILTAVKEITVLGTGLNESLSNTNDITIKSFGNGMITISLSEMENYKLKIFNVNGQLISNKEFWGSSIDLTLPSTGLYVISILGERSVYSKKVLIN